MADDGKGFSGSAPGSAPPPAKADLPPSYDDSQSAIGAGGFQVPQQQQQQQLLPGATASGPPPAPPHSQQQQQRPPVVIQYVGQTVPFGPDPQEMTCPKCQSRIRTTVEKEPGAMAWIVAGVLCFTGWGNSH